MKKRILFISLAVVLALSVGLIGCTTEEDEEPTERQVITLDFATFWPSGDFQAGEGHVSWMSAITDVVEENTPNDDTGYTVEWNVSWGVHPGELWSGVLAGTYDVITSGPGYTGGIMPLWSGPEYPASLCRQNSLTMSMTLQALYDEFTPLQDQMDDAGVKVMHFWSTGPGYFLMTEGNDVRTLEDFEALTKPIRAATPACVVTIEALGAEPLYCPMSVALEKFEAGLLSGILCPTDTPKGFGLGAYVRSATFAPFAYHFVFMKVMYPGTWDDLPDEVQDVFDDVNAAWPEYYGQLRTWGETDGLTYCRSEIEGWTDYDLRTEDPTEYARWEDACAGLIVEWIGDDSTRQDLWDRFVDLDEYYCTHDPWMSWTPGTLPPEPPF